MGFGTKVAVGCAAAATVAGAGYIMFTRLYKRPAAVADPEECGADAGLDTAHPVRRSERMAQKQDYYEWLWGEGWVSPGGLRMTEALLECLVEFGLKVPAKDAMRVLDVHTGTGGAAFHMCDRYGAHVTGIDQGSLIADARTRALRQSRTNMLHFFDVDVYQQLTNGQNKATYDLVWCREGFPFYTDVQKREIFRALPRQLRRGGMIGFTEFCQLPGPLSDTSGPFQHFIQARGSDLYSVRNYQSLLEKSLSASCGLQTWDLSAQLITQFQSNLEFLNANQGEFERKFGREAFDSLQVELKSRQKWLEQEYISFTLFVVKLNA